MLERRSTKVCQILTFSVRACMRQELRSTHREVVIRRSPALHKIASSVRWATGKKECWDTHAAQTSHMAIP